MARAGRARDMFCRSQKSWAAILDGEVFAKGKVRVDAAVKRVNREGLAFWWSVERLPYPQNPFGLASTTPNT